MGTVSRAGVLGCVTAFWFLCFGGLPLGLRAFSWAGLGWGVMAGVLGCCADLLLLLGDVCGGDVGGSVV